MGGEARSSVDDVSCEALGKRSVTWQDGRCVVTARAYYFSSVFYTPLQYSAEKD